MCSLYYLRPIDWVDNVLKELVPPGPARPQFKRD